MDSADKSMIIIGAGFRAANSDHVGEAADEEDL